MDGSGVMGEGGHQPAGYDLDLREEIRLLREVLAVLAPDPAGNAATIRQVTATLARLVQVQRGLGDESGLEAEIVAAADSILVEDHQKREAAAWRLRPARPDTAASGSGTGAGQ